eukprot:2399980-Pyramimonas_sp.AAC.1
MSQAKRARPPQNFENVSTHGPSGETRSYDKCPLGTGWATPERSKTEHVHVYTESAPDERRKETDLTRDG